MVPNVHVMPPGKAASAWWCRNRPGRGHGVRRGRASCIAFYTATIGSEHDPLPLGEWKITGVGRNPGFHYNPELFWDARPGPREKAKIAPGPNNPVGVVWIDLSKEHYGIHGTPVPSTGGPHGLARLHPPH